MINRGVLRFSGLEPLALPCKDKRLFFILIAGCGFFRDCLVGRIVPTLAEGTNAGCGFGRWLTLDGNHVF